MEEACATHGLERDEADACDAHQPAGGPLRAALEAHGGDDGYARALRGALGTYATTADEDAALLAREEGVHSAAAAPSCAAHRQRLVIEYRLSQKRLLTSELSRVSGSR